jgi:hypothetical protein
VRWKLFLAALVSTTAAGCIAFSVLTTNPHKVCPSFLWFLPAMQPYRDNPFDDRNSSGLYDPYNVMFFFFETGSNVFFCDRSLPDRYLVADTDSFQPAPTRQYTSSPLNPGVQKSLPPAPAHPAFDLDPADSTDDLTTPTAAIYEGARPRNLPGTAAVAGSTPIYNRANPTAETLWMTDMSREGGSEPKYNYKAPAPNKKKWVVSGSIAVVSILLS